VEAIALHEKHGCPASFASGGMDESVQCLPEGRGRIQRPKGLGQSSRIGQLSHKTTDPTLESLARILESAAHFHE
jgi:hypothetical protein